MSGQTDHYGEGWRLCFPDNWLVIPAWHPPHWLRPGEPCTAWVDHEYERNTASWGEWECMACRPINGQLFKHFYRVWRQMPKSKCPRCGGYEWRRVDEDAYGPLPPRDPDAEPEEPTMAEREAAGQGVLL